MRVFLLSIVAAVALTLGGGLLLRHIQEPVSKAFTAGSVRL